MIDIQSLHIGSHVLFNGERVEVCTLDSLNGFIGIKEHCGVDANGMRFAVAHTPDKYDPIPITEELLTELGFESYTDNNTEIWRKTYNADHPDIKRGFGTIRTHRCSDGWVIDIYPYILECDYLHIAEAFVYLTTKQRLI